jgi:2-octaprenylphenol hydroxylase
MMAAGRRHDFDVVISGGGMVGSCIAALMAREQRLADWRVAMLEPLAARPPRDDTMDLRVSALSRASERILDAAGAWTSLQASASPYTDMVVWDAGSGPDAGDALRFSAAETGEPDLGHIVENIRVQWALRNSPSMREVTELQTGLEGLQIDEDAAHLTLGDGRRLSCGLLIGADGARSPARTLAGIARSGWQYDQTAVVAHLSTEKPHRQTAWQRFLPTGPIAFLPLADGRVSLVWSTTPEDAEALQACTEIQFAQKVTEASDRVLGEVTLEGHRAGFPLGLWHSNEYVRPRLALAGDAAHTIHPMAGQGVNLGFLDCASLVEVLAEALDDGEDPFGARVLRRYQRWRRSENALVMGVTDGLKRLFGAQDMTVAALRRTGLSLVGRQAPLRRAFVRRALGLSGDLPDLLKSGNRGSRN